MKTLAPSVTHRDPKGRKFISIVETAYDKADLSEEEAQRVNNTPGLSKVIADFIAENRTPNKYKDEEVASTYGYLSGYKKPKPIAEQVKILRGIFPELGSVDEGLAEREVPKNAEGWFAIPKWQTIAPTYAEAVQKVLDAIKTARNGKFRNYRDGQIVNEHLRQSAKSEAMFQKLGDEQSGHDILVMATQFGLLHRGRSVRRVLEVMTESECGLGAFTVGIMILTHQERLQHYDDLGIDCAGDEFDDPDADARFEHAPYFRFHDGKVKFFTSRVDAAHGYYGSASAFVPQS